MHIADLRGPWKDPVLAPVLWEKLARVWQVERDAPAQEDPPKWWHYQDELAYALGQLGAFDVPTFLEVPAPSQRVWTVNMALVLLC